MQHAARSISLLNKQIKAKGQKGRKENSIYRKSSGSESAPLHLPLEGAQRGHLCAHSKSGE